MAKLKPLQLGTSLEDLEQYSAIPDVRSKSIKILLNTAQKLYTNAEEQRLDGDEELAYVTYMKYFNLLSCIHKKREYAENKHVVRQMLGDNEQNRRIMDKLERLSDSLTLRYEQLNNERMRRSATPTTHDIRGGGIHNGTAAAATKSQAASTIAMPHRMQSPNGYGKFGLISCQQLFERIEEKNVLIMDCRTVSDFESSHLTYTWSFNVPEEIIAAGMSAGKLQDRLSSQAKAMWAARSIKEHVVLMDWNTKDAEPATNMPIGILLDILKNWDPDTTYRAPIQILEGGYEYFIMMYPTYSTNPTVQAPKQNNNDIDTMEEIEYPSIDDITMKDELRENGFSHNATSSRARPSIDRSSKRAAMRTYDEKYNKPIQEIMQEQDALLQKAQQNDDLLEKAAQKWHSIVELKRLSADGVTLSSSDQQLLYTIMQLESTAKDFKEENTRLRDELNQYKQQEKRPLSPRDAEVTKQIETKIQERELLDEQHERERVERERLLSIAREAKRHYKTPTTPTTPTTSTSKLQTVAEDFAARQLNGSGDNHNYYVNGVNNEELDVVVPVASANVDIGTGDGIITDDNKENAYSMQARPQFDRSRKPPQSTVFNNYNLLETRKRDFSPVVSANVGRGLTGLKNLGNTCYMNSILQCLSNTPQLTEYCITDKYKNYISRNNKTKGHIVEEVAALIKILWNGNYKCVASKDLRYVVGQYQQIFRGVEQQDSHEFLTILMDWLHSDLQTLSVSPRIRDNINASDKAWLDFTKSKESLILHLFYGQIKSTVKCVVCQKESATYECFSNLSLELPQASSNVCHLNQCMQMYFSGENIHGWNCPNCEQKRDAIKKLDISKLPPVLVVHLKRFYADTDGSGNSYKKKQNYLRFPLEQLDMTPYIAKTESRSSTPKTYQLYGVSNHYGTMESGHYTAFCKSANYGRWFKFDDQVVTALDTSNVVSSAAYILFYTWLPPIQISESAMN